MLHYIILTPLKLARSISHVNLVQRQTCQIGVLVKREKKRKKGRERGREEKQCRHDTTEEGEREMDTFRMFYDFGFIFFFGPIDPWKITLKRSSLLEDNRQLFEIIRTG